MDSCQSHPDMVPFFSSGPGSFRQTSDFHDGKRRGTAHHSDNLRSQVTYCEPDTPPLCQERTFRTLLRLSQPSTDQQLQPAEHSLLPTPHLQKLQIHMHIAIIHPAILPPPFAPSTLQPPTSCSFFSGQRCR